MPSWKHSPDFKVRNCRKPPSEHLFQRGSSSGFTPDAPWLRTLSRTLPRVMPSKWFSPERKMLKSIECKRSKIASLVKRGCKPYGVSMGPCNGSYRACIHRHVLDRRSCLPGDRLACVPCEEEQTGAGSSRTLKQSVGERFACYEPGLLLEGKFVRIGWKRILT